MIAPGFERRVAAAALAGALCWSQAAAAHAPPAATDLQWLGSRALVRSNRGLIVQGAGAADASFRIVCNEAFRTSLVEVPPLATTSDGRILVGTFEAGLLLSTPDGCSFSPVAGALAGVNAVAATTDAAGRLLALVLPTDGGPAALFDSRDDARSFGAVASFTDVPNALRVAPTNANRLYVSTLGVSANDTFARLLHSNDAGLTFQELPIELDASELRAFVLAVDPVAADVVFVRTQSRDGLTPERLLRSDDGGQSFAAVLAATGPLSVAIADDGTVWAGGASGLYRSSDGGRTFSPLPALDLSRVTCLATRSESLYVCGYHAGEFGVLSSTDQGHSLAWFLRFPDVQARQACAAQSDEGLLCEAAFADWSAEQSPPAAAGDGSTEQSPPPAIGGSSAVHATPAVAPASCGFANPGQRPLQGLLLLLLPWAVAMRARREPARKHVAGKGSGLALAAAALLLACGSKEPEAASDEPAQPEVASRGGTAAASFEDECLTGAVTACERCLCTDCSAPVQDCTKTSGCPEIAACIRETGCAGIACYCGNFAAVACAAGQADGPCKATILEAPGSSTPSLLEPSAGPASDAAVAIAGCMQPGQSCAEACSTGG